MYRRLLWRPRGSSADRFAPLSENRYDLQMIPRALGVAASLFCLTSNVSAEPVRLSTALFGESAEVEVRELPVPAADAAARAALLEMHELAQLLDPESTLEGSLGALNSHVGESRKLDDRVARALLRSLNYCVWSSGAHGPLAGGVYPLWSSSPELLVPDPEELRQALAGAECNRLNLSGSPSEEGSMRGAIAEGTRVELVGLAKGFVVDRAFEVLAEHGVENAWVEIGNVMRASGGGPEGEGWPVTLPTVHGMKDPPEVLLLRDQSLAISGVGASGDESIRWIDLRTGVPAHGVIQVVTVARPAFDAQALSTIMYITGLREGQRRLGVLEPRPSVRWFLGGSARTKTPLESTYRWSEVARFQP